MENQAFLNIKTCLKCAITKEIGFYTTNKPYSHTNEPYSYTNKNALIASLI